MPTGAAAKRSKITKFEKSVDTCFCTCYYIKVVSSESLEKTSVADVAELADALDLGSSAFGRAGSIPVIRIIGLPIDMPT